MKKTSSNNHSSNYVYYLASIIVLMALIPVAAQAATVSLGSTTATIAELTGEILDDNAGYAVSSTGDVNNDGYSDLLVGGNLNDDGGADAGAAYLIYGQSAALTSASLGASTIVEFTGEVAGDRAGTSVASAGDVNNDGYDDILVGANLNDDVAVNAGAVYLIYGQSAALTSASLSTAVEFTGEVAGDSAGESVSSAGDVNNDGYDDILVGAYTNDDVGGNAGAVYLIYGQSAALTSASLSTAVEFTGEVAGDLAGDYVSSAGDVNNDGYDDIVIGADVNDDAASGAGAIYIIYGQAATLTSASLSTAVEFTGEVTNDQAGISVASAGDVNNDGYDDILVGAYGNDDGGSSNTGAAYLIYGQAATLTSASLSTAVEFTGEVAGDRAGTSVASAGDVNNDGYDDILVGANFNDDAATGAGAAYLIFGQATALTAASLGTATIVELTGEAENDTAGNSVASAGDVNNDGYDDLLVGAYVNDDAATGAGAAYLAYAQPSTVTVTNNTSTVNTIECATGTFTDPGATATDQYTNTSLTVSTPTTVANTPTGTTTVTYTTANNTLLITGSATRTVTVADTAIPTITLTGSSSITHEAGTAYTDAGATATDVCDSSVSVSATTLNVNTLGAQTITYSASDDSSNSATQQSRTVTVLDTTVPVLTLVGEATVTIQQDAVYTDAGATATDSFAGTLTSSIVIVNAVDTAVPGSYIVTYNVLDPSGNVATELSRTVTVVEHGAITTATKNGGDIDLVYADDYTESIEPFSGSTRFVFALTTDELGIVVTNGKLVRVFVDGVKVDQKKINKKTLRSKFITLKVKKLYASKSYDDVMIMLAKKQTGKVNHLRFTGDNELTKFQHQVVAISERQPGTITVRTSKHRFITQFGNGADKTRSVWKVTRRGVLRVD